MAINSPHLCVTAPAGDAEAPCLLHANMQSAVWRDMVDQDSIAEWDALSQRASSPNPFFESWSLIPALEEFDKAGRVQLLRLEVGGALAGLIPLVQASRYYRHRLPQWSVWMHGNCFLGVPLVARGLERQFWAAMFQWADSHARGALFLHLSKLPLEGQLHEALLATLAEQHRSAWLVHREQRALLRSPLSSASYLDEALTGKKRKELRRQYSRLSELGELRFERQDDMEHLDQWIDAFLELEASSWKGRSGSAMALESATARLFKATLQGAAERGRLERLTLSLDGAPIAMLVTFIATPGAFAYKTAFDERFARFSPGVLLQRENLRLLDREDIEWCDSCASADHPMIDHFWRERRIIGRMNIAIGGAVRRTAFRAVAWAETRRNPWKIV